MKKNWLAAITAGSVLLSAAAMATEASAADYRVQLKPFPDVAVADWSQKYVYTLSNLNLVAGFTDGTFHPNAEVTREAWVQMLVSAANQHAAVNGTSASDPAGAIGASAGGSAFVMPADVAASRWSYKPVQTAAQAGWIDFMIQNGKLLPAQEATREEVAASVGKYLLSLTTDAEATAWLQSDWKKESAASPFADEKQMNAKLAPFVYYTVHLGVMVGSGDNFRPKDSLSRKESAAVIYNLLDRDVRRQSLDFTGIYAIDSYRQAARIDSVNDVFYGWSHLVYEGSGKASLDMSSGSWSIPDGAEEVTGMTDVKGLPTDLMIFNNDAALPQFLRDAGAQTAFIADVKSVLNSGKYGFDGICIDFEGLTDAANRDAYTAFLQKVKAALGDRYSLSAAVPPLKYQHGYDFAAIGQIADSVLLMAHDFTDKSNLLPSAPLPYTTEAIVQALEFIPKEKLILGVSKQANQWTMAPGAAGWTYSGPNSTMVEQRLAKQGTKEQFSYPYFLDLLTFQDERGKHQIWYEDTQSIESKIWLAKYFGLKGVSLWYMGEFTDKDWKMIGQQ